MLLGETLIMAQDERGTWFWPRILDSEFVFRMYRGGFLTADTLRDRMGFNHDRTT